MSDAALVWRRSSLPLPFIHSTPRPPHPIPRRHNSGGAAPAAGRLLHCFLNHLKVVQLGERRRPRTARHWRRGARTDFHPSSLPSEDQGRPRDVYGNLRARARTRHHPLRLSRGTEDKEPLSWAGGGTLSRPTDTVQGWFRWRGRHGTTTTTAALRAV